MGKGGFKAVLHCFTSTEKLARAGLDLGFFISFSGVLTFKKSKELRRIAKIVPPERLLVETDAPYLSPEPHRGKRNEPAFVVETAKILASTLAMGFEEVANLTTMNFHRLFEKATTASRSGETVSTPAE
jgi:TatD DNase family protein